MRRALRRDPPLRGEPVGVDAAEDVVAGTFLTAFRNRSRDDAARGGVRTWLYGIATNLISMQRRAEMRALRAMAARDRRLASPLEGRHPGRLPASAPRAPADAAGQGGVGTGRLSDVLHLPRRPVRGHRRPRRHRLDGAKDHPGKPQAAGQPDLRPSACSPTCQAYGPRRA
nr:sigma factor [Nonomuraea terrae]